MKKKIKMVFVTQNMAPFRALWLDELSKYIDIVVYHLNEYDSTVNSKYLSCEANNFLINKDFIRISNKKVFNIKKIIEEKADILVLDGYGFFGQVVLIAYLRLFHIPFYMSVDGGFIPENEFIAKKMLKSFCLNGPKGFFSTSEITDKFISHYLKKNPLLYRHYFSTVYSDDISAITQKQKFDYKRKLGIKNKFTVITVGRFIPIKGFDILLKAAAMTHNDVFFIFVGGKPTDEYKYLIDAINSDNILFVDFLSKSELKEYYYASDVFVFPSRGDVWGLVVGEAMACGLPIISSSKCIAALSMVKTNKNGFIINDENPESYYSKILELKNDGETQKRMSDNSHEIIRKYAIDFSAINDIMNIETILNVKIIEEVSNA